LYQNIKIPANGRPMGSMKDIMQIVRVTEGLHLDVLGKFHICRDTTSGRQINDKHTFGSSVTFDVTKAHSADFEPSVLPQHCSERYPPLCTKVAAVRSLAIPRHIQPTILRKYKHFPNFIT
jgi:hypothetical protein